MGAKKLIAVTVAMLFMVSLAYGVPATNNSGPGDILGQGKLDAQAHKIFRLVRFVPTGGSNTSIGISPESIVIWDTVSDDGVTVTTSTTSGDNAVAGVIAATTVTPEYGCLGNTATTDAGKRNWTWLQTYGYAKVLVATNLTCVAGDKLGTSTQAGAASTFTQTGTLSGGVSGWAGIFYDAVSIAAGGDDAEMFIKGLD